MFPIFSENGDAVAFGGRILPGSHDPAKYKNSRRDGDLREVEDAVRAELGEGRHRRGRSGDRVRGLHRRDRVPPGGRAACRRHVRHRAHRGARAPAEAVSPARSCWRSMPTPPVRVRPSGSTSGSRSTRCEVSVAAFPQGKDPGELSLSDPEALARGGRRRVAVPRVPAAADAARADAADTPEAAGAAGRGGDGGRQRASQRQRPQAVRGPGGGSRRAAGRRPRRGCRARIAARRRSRCQPAEQRARRSENAEFVAIALLVAALGRDRAVVGRGRCSSTT